MRASVCLSLHACSKVAKSQAMQQKRLIKHFSNNQFVSMKSCLENLVFFMIALIN